MTPPDIDMDEAWALVRTLAEDLDDEQMDAEGVSAGSGVGRAADAALTDAERIELARLLQEQLRPPAHRSPRHEDASAAVPIVPPLLRWQRHRPRATLRRHAQDQSPPGRSRRSPRAGAPGRARGDARRLRVVQAQNALQLNDAQYGAVRHPAETAAGNAAAEQQARNRLLQELAEAWRPRTPAPTRTRSASSCKALRDHDEQSAAALQRDSEALDEVLDVRQQARFRLLEERLERQKLDLLMRARARGGRRQPARAERPGGRLGPQRPGLQ